MPGKAAALPSACSPPAPHSPPLLPPAPLPAHLQVAHAGHHGRQLGQLVAADGQESEAGERAQRLPVSGLQGGVGVGEAAVQVENAQRSQLGHLRGHRQRERGRRECGQVGWERASHRIATQSNATRGKLRGASASASPQRAAVGKPGGWARQSTSGPTCRGKAASEFSDRLRSSRAVRQESTEKLGALSWPLRSSVRLRGAAGGGQRRPSCAGAARNRAARQRGCKGRRGLRSCLRQAGRSTRRLAARLGHAGLAQGSEANRRSAHKHSLCPQQKRLCQAPQLACGGAAGAPGRRAARPGRSWRGRGG